MEYIEATIADIEAANAIAHEVLGRSLDELPPQTRRVLASIVSHVHARRQQTSLPRADIRFTRRELREAAQQGDTQMKLHLSRLAELEYLMVHRAERGQGYVYELVFDGDPNAKLHLSGLIDTATLMSYDARWSGSSAERSEQVPPQSARGRGADGGLSGVNRLTKTAAKPMNAGLTATLPDAEGETSMGGESDAPPSYARRPSYERASTALVSFLAA